MYHALLYQSSLTPRFNCDYNLLLAAALEKTTRLGVEVLIAISNQRADQFRLGVFLPLNGPVHGSVCHNEGRDNVESLVTEATENIEDGSVTSTGEGTLTVSGQRVGSNALGSRATCEADVSHIPNLLPLLVFFSSVSVRYCDPPSLIKDLLRLHPDALEKIQGLWSTYRTLPRCR